MASARASELPPRDGPGQLVHPLSENRARAGLVRTSFTSVLESRRLQNYPWCVGRLLSRWFGTWCGWVRSARKMVTSSSHPLLPSRRVDRGLGFTETRLRQIA